MQLFKNRSNKIHGILILTLLTSTVMIPVQNINAYAAANDTMTISPPTINAPAAELIDAKTGQVLYAKNIDARREPASTTKLMTLLLIEQAIQSGKAKLTDIVPVTPEAIRIETEGSGAWLKQGEKWTLEDMIKFITVPSGNDAAVATAQYLAGSIPAFVDRMNEEAKKLGLTNTHFANPDGLHDPNHYTSAHDLAIIARTLITQYPDILKYTSIQSMTVRNGQNIFQNTDTLLGKYQGLDGLKTGYTDQAGYCFVGTAQQNNMRLIDVVLGTNSEEARFTESTKLLDYGFQNFKEYKLASKNQPIKQTAPVNKGVNTEVGLAPVEDAYVAVQPGQEKLIQTHVSIGTITAPVKKGQKIGKLEYILNGKVIETVELQATKNDDKASFIRLFFRGIGYFIGNLFHGIFSGIGHLFKK
ncbi:D-alanyl-D-alanine carboxypeptidase [Fodinisporobacter ferrooxydans]|uniref:serine-type D-Ala-D-Ala carboxypeptidase n=1 Tax=Fodinisporobacter ferrooxydans TaxID=2901836 RepID=A0ABY4CMQ3_9BACL|nr:D-alanyl-D-alanine carboxypeptidase [Alicyclobacillaceae bacterium MYW30-H2]